MSVRLSVHTTWGNSHRVLTIHCYIHMTYLGKQTLIMALKNCIVRWFFFHSFLIEINLLELQNKFNEKQI